MILKNRNPYQKELEQFDASSPRDGKIFAENIIAQAREREIPLEKDPEILRESADLELEKQVPPQVYAVVAGVMDLLRKLEEEAPHEGNPGHEKYPQQRRP